MTGTKRGAGPAVVDMNDLQLLAHLIHMSGVGLTQARALSHSLLDAHQTLARVLALPGEALLRFPGLSEGTVAFLLLVPALVERYTSDLQTPHPYIPQLWSQADVEAFVRPHFQGQATERMCVFCLGKDLALRTASMVTQGGVGEVSCSVPRILKLALTHHADSVILAHNHPDGSTLFSKSDLLATSVVAQALATVGVSLADHLLVVDSQIISLRATVASWRESDPAFIPPPAWLADRALWADVQTR